MGRRNLSQIDLPESIDAYYVQSTGFFPDRDIVNATKLLDDYFDLHVIPVTKEFDDDRWVFRHRYFNTIRTFDFSNITELTRFSDSVRSGFLTSAFKCWVAFALSKKALDTAHTQFCDVFSALYTTKGFPDEQLDSFIELLMNRTAYKRTTSGEFEIADTSDISLNIYIRNVIDFLGFCDPVRFVSYIDKLSEIKVTLRPQTGPRSIPPFIDFLKFKMYFDDWLERVSNSVNDHEQSQRLRFFPLILWWSITAIIPMRPSEFCTIRRDCLSQDEWRCFLTFPRHKLHRTGAHRMEDRFDTLPIPQDIYNDINWYIDATEAYGHTDYLIHFNAFVHLNRRKPPSAASEEQSDGEQIDSGIGCDDERQFTIDNLTRLIAGFYRDILHREYHVNIGEIRGNFKSALQVPSLINRTELDSINEMIKPGDLRHVAILSMMLQGYDRVEIQRLSGHITQSEQYNYQNHMEFWVDSQIHQLATQFTAMRISLDDSDVSLDSKDAVHPLAFRQYNELFKRTAFLQDKTKVPKKQKLHIGVCKDPDMPCPSFNWRHRGCYFCDNWRISLEELRTHRQSIMHDLNEIYDELRSKVVFLKSLLRGYEGQRKEVDLETKRQGKVTSEEIQLGIVRVAELLSLLGGSE